MDDDHHQISYITKMKKKMKKKWKKSESAVMFNWAK
jgi:hypothetical protein